MKISFLFLLMFIITGSFAQNLQVHYDLRHSTDPKLNARNFPTFSFEYFKEVDTMKTGSFLFKLDAHLDGKHNNTGQVFTQISQSLRFWKPKIYLSLNYSGGLGVTETSNGYYLANAFGIGVAYPFQLYQAWFSTSVSFRINVFDKPSYDPQLTIYFGRGFINYRLFVAGSFVFWTENKNQGNEYTKDFTGKKFAFFGDPQCWIRIKKGLSVGSRFNIYYHVLSADNRLRVYPTIGIKYQF